VYLVVVVGECGVELDLVAQNAGVLLAKLMKRHDERMSERTTAARMRRESYGVRTMAGMALVRFTNAGSPRAILSAKAKLRASASRWYDSCLGPVALPVSVQHQDGEE
jgi:hypothetical protein